MNRRLSAWNAPLRCLSLLLACCFLWSFLGAGIAAAASPLRQTVTARKALVPTVPLAPGSHISPFVLTPQPAAHLNIQSLPLPASMRPDLCSTLLDEVGHLASFVSPGQVAAWRQELKAPGTASSRAAQLHVWLGEWELAKNEQPWLARQQFHSAQALSSKRSAVSGLAAYDAAVALFYAGAYSDAIDAFHALQAAQYPAYPYSHLRCNIWLRHVSACAAYHAAHSAIGIPEPPRLDPFCGAAALATCQRSLSAPYDRQTILSACRVTGEGSTLVDVLKAARKLGMTAEAVTADDTGLQLLPKPLVAYVERDHFVAVVRADKHGVSYLCSDCGMWPGGQVDLTWRQWHTMNAGLYGVVTRPASLWSRRMAALSNATSGKPYQVASANGVKGLLSNRVDALLPFLRNHVVLTTNPGSGGYCGSSPPVFVCQVDGSTPTDSPSGGGVPGHGGSGPYGRPMYAASGGDPVNLATGEEEYSPAADLTIYNPVGPSVVWQRTYRSLRGPGQSYPYYSYDATCQSDDFGVSWSQPYNVGVIDTVHQYAAGNRSVVFENGSKVVFVPPSSGSTVPTAGHPVLYPAQRSGFPMILQWDYDATSSGHFEVIMKDRTRWITGTLTAPGSVSPLTQITDRNGNSIYFNYTSTSTSRASYNWPLLGSITTGSGGTGTALLTITRATDGTGNITSVTDLYQRSVYYTNTLYYNQSSYYYAPTYQELTQVSQIVPTGSASPPSRWNYGYELVGNGEGSEEVNYLHTISVPSPTGNGLSTSTIWYSNDPASGNPNYGNPSPNLPFVSALVDANGNQRLYTSVNASGTVSYPSTYTKVTVKNSNGVAYTYTAGYDGTTMNGTTTTDGAGHVLATTVYSTLEPNLPATVTDGNGKTTGYTWDSYGNMLTMTPPTSAVRTPAVTTNTYSYTNFALGEMTQTQTGSKTPTSYTYYDTVAGDYSNSGLVKTITGPLPSSADGSGAYLLSTCVYDNLGNPTSLYKLGPNSIPTTSTASLTPSTYTQTSYSYLNGYDGYRVSSGSIDQPLTVSVQGLDASGSTTSQPSYFQYDAQGNVTAVIDALGNKTTQSYTIANAPLQTVLPATGQSGSGNAGSANSYLYTEPASFATMQWPAITLQYGPLYTTTQYDEATPTAHAIRQVVNTYGLEGELLNVSGSTEPVTYAYDALYRLTRLKDAVANTTSYFYNTAGYLAQVVYPGAPGGMPTVPLASGTKDTVSYTGYDGEGDLLTRVDGRNQTTTYSYNDPEKLLTDVTYPAGTIGAVHLVYDAYGRRASMTDGTGGQTYAYDDDDNLTQKTVTYTGLASQPITYTYNPDGSRQGMMVSSQTRPWSYTYDGVGRLNTVVDYPSETTTYGYQANGWLLTKMLSNGVVATMTRDAQGRITDLVYKLGTTTLSDFHVPASGGYDGVGNRLSVTATVNGGAQANYSGTTAYAYDYGQTANPTLNRSQLTGESSTRASGTQSYAYDGNTSGGPGNPTSFKGTSNTFNADNQVTNTGYSYDGAGNPTTYKSQALTFDPENRLTSDSTATEANAYSGDGLRAWKQAGANSASRVYFLYDGDQPVIELTSVGGFGAANTFGADGLASSRRFSPGNGTVCYLYDERGNVSQRTSSTGSVMGNELYDAYGGRTGTAAQSDPWGFGAQAGYYTDTETGLILCTHRFYDPSAGRWLTRDPMDYDGGINLYGYCQNNPANEDDADGTGAPVLTGGGIPVVEPPVVEPLPIIGTGVGTGIGIGVGVLTGIGVIILTGVLLIGAGPAGPPNEFPPGYFERQRISCMAKGGKSSGKGDDPRYKKSCAELQQDYDDARRSGNNQQAADIYTIMKFKGCKGSGGRKGTGTGGGRRR